MAIERSVLLLVIAMSSPHHGTCCQSDVLYYSAGDR